MLTPKLSTAHYGGDDVFEHFPMLKLATMVINRNDIFSRDVALRGRAIKFGSHTNAGDSEDEGNEAPEELDSIEAPTLELDNTAPLLLSTTKPRTANRYAHDHDELDDLLQPVGKVSLPKSTDIIHWLEDIYNGSRGFELGTFDASIIPIIWKKQLVNWDSTYFRPP